jgi:hypothetical protein
MLPSDFFRRNIVLSLPEGAIGIRPLDLIGVDPRSRKILAEILAGVPDDEQAKPAPDRDPGNADGNTACVYQFSRGEANRPCLNLLADGAGQHWRYQRKGLHLHASRRTIERHPA